MCFSAEASFTAAVLLGAIGSITLKNNSSGPQIFLAAIPLLFAAQQFSEGIVWLHLTRQFGSHELFINAQRSFLIFAFLVWPIWIPFSVSWVEKVTWRRYVMYLVLVAGLMLSFTNLFYAMNQKITVNVVNHSLQYLGQVPAQTFLYPFIVLFPCFLSSFKNIRNFGILVAIGYVIASYFYMITFVSVWCFFAAIVSISIYKILKDNESLPDKQPFNR